MGALPFTLRRYIVEQERGGETLTREASEALEETQAVTPGRA
jgi:hypothetical protein